MIAKYLKIDGQRTEKIYDFVVALEVKIIDQMA